MTTAREWILLSVTNRPSTVLDLTAMLIGKGYPSAMAESMAVTWTGVTVDRKQISAQTVDGVTLFTLANADYEKQQTDPAQPKSANEVWRDAIAKHNNQKGKA